MGSRGPVAVTFVAGQFLLLGLVLFLPQGHAWPVPGWALWLAGGAAACGLALMLVAAAGLGRGLTALPVPNEHALLRTSGLYRWMRHPIYSGLLLVAAARTAVSGSVWTIVAFIALFCWMVAKAHWEEGRLVERFPDYRAYAARTGRFLPRLIRR